MTVLITFDSTTENHSSWFSATVAHTTTDPHSGAGCLSWTAESTFSGVIVSTPFPLTGISPGDVIDWSMWTKGASGAFDTQLYWEVKYLDASNNQVGSTVVLQPPVSGSWTQFVSGPSTVPTGATKVTWEISTDNAATGSVILLDDIRGGAGDLDLVERIGLLAARARDEFNAVRGEIDAIPAGPAGADGDSAYEVAVASGFVGTEAEWLDSLVGPQGEVGPAGPEGDVGPAGPEGDAGTAGAPGADGDSAYEVAVANGFVGTEVEWLASLEGPQGEQGIQGPQGVPGDDGAPGADGADGADGLGVILLEVGATTPPGGTPTGTIIYRKI